MIKIINFYYSCDHLIYTILLCVEGFVFILIFHNSSNNKVYLPYCFNKIIDSLVVICYDRNSCDKHLIE